MKRIILFILFLCTTNCFALDIYNYDGEGYFLSKGVAGVSPLDRKPLIPRNATTIKPPISTETEEPKFESGEWVMVASRDYIKKQETDKQVLLQTKNADGIFIYKVMGGGVIIKTIDEIATEKQFKLIQAEKERLRTIEDTKLEEQAKINLGLK